MSKKQLMLHVEARKMAVMTCSYVRRWIKFVSVVMWFLVGISSLVEPMAA